MFADFNSTRGQGHFGGPPEKFSEPIRIGPSYGTTSVRCVLWVSVAEPDASAPVTVIV
jgi:hypothetical protein